MPTIVSVQALRAVAAIAVALHHFDNFNDLLAGQRQGPHQLEFLACGVDLFFVISGFVMVYASRELFTAPGAVQIFLARRVGRIVPMYWLTTAIAIPLMSRPDDLFSVVASLTFIPFAGGPSYGVGWTLNFEMYFYVLFAVALALPRTLAVSTLGCLMVAFVGLGQWIRPTAAPLTYWTDPIILEFLMGMIVAQLFIGGARLPGYFRIALIAAGCVALSQTIGLKLSSPIGTPRFVFWGIPAALIFAGAVLGREPDFGWLRRPLKVLGDASYAIYLFHAIAIGTIFKLWAPVLNHYPKLLTLSVGFALTILVSIFAHYLFERPMQKLISQMLSVNRNTSAAMS